MQPNFMSRYKIKRDENEEAASLSLTTTRGTLIIYWRSERNIATILTPAIPKSGSFSVLCVSEVYKYHMKFLQ